MNTKLIETDTKKGIYELECRRIICEHKNEGRLLIVQGYGGNSIEGQTYRFKHGAVYKVESNSNLEIIDSQIEECECSIDELFPVLDWSGAVIAKVAKNLLKE